FVDVEIESQYGLDEFLTLQKRLLPSSGCGARCNSTSDQERLLYTLEKGKLVYAQITYHPDVAGRNAGTESKFIEITEAYECLKDPERRRIYDGDSVGRGGRYTDRSSDFRVSRKLFLMLFVNETQQLFQQHFGQRRENPFYSKRYTQQEYERIWEQFKRMQQEREAYDAQMRREGEKLWEQFARERATRWQQFHS
ncbi:DnaJ domain protein, partial [Ostertagia ostertagi]